MFNIFAWIRAAHTLFMKHWNDLLDEDAPSYIILFQVFKYYESIGVLELEMITLVGGQPNHPILTNLFLYGKYPFNYTNPIKHLNGNQRLSVHDCYLKGSLQKSGVP